LKISADTNVLVRACVKDDPEQALIAVATLENARLVALPIVTLCEFVWVLGRAYKYTATEIAQAIRKLIHAKNVVCDLPAVEAGLALLYQGYDFADGAIAFSGRGLGANEFVSFDKAAVSALKAQHIKARLLKKI
jgi:predicted nucleic-acid-binding protein